jgi:hypothetical protein
MGRNNADFQGGVNHGNEYRIEYKGVTPRVSTFETGRHLITATHIPTGEQVGDMYWEDGHYDDRNDSHGVISIGVDEDHQRKGIATAMWRYGKSLHARYPDKITEPVHDDAMSESAEHWARAVGH